MLSFISFPAGRTTCDPHAPGKPIRGLLQALTLSSNILLNPKLLYYEMHPPGRFIIQLPETMLAAILLLSFLTFRENLTMMSIQRCAFSHYEDHMMNVNKRGAPFPPLRNCSVRRAPWECGFFWTAAGTRPPAYFLSLPAGTCFCPFLSNLTLTILLPSMSTTINR